MIMKELWIGSREVAAPSGHLSCSPLHRDAVERDAGDLAFGAVVVRTGVGSFRRLYREEAFKSSLECGWHRRYDHRSNFVPVK